MITNKIGYKVYSNKPFAIWANSRIINERLSANSYNQDYLDFAKAKNTFNFKKVSDIAIVTAMIGWKGLTTDDYVDEDGVYLLRTVDIKDNYIDLENAIMAKREKVYEQPQIILKQGDIIFSKDGTLGITAIVPRHQNKEMCVGSTLARIRLNSNLDNYYVCAAFMSKIVQVQIGYFTSGIAQPHITQEYINKLEIPIPSPEIQKYIGDKVRKAEELREEAKRLKKEAEEILINEIGFNNVNKGNAKYHWIKEDIVDDRIDSDFYDLKYQVLIEIEKKFNCYLMEDIIVDKYTGKTPGKEYDDIKGIPLIVVKNVEENILNLDNIDRRIKDNNSFKKTEENDLLITRVGSVGVVSIVEENEKGLFLSDNVICLKLKEGLFNRYIAFYLNSIYGKLMVERWTKGAVQGVINYESINKFKVPIMDNNIMKEIDLKILKWKQLLAISKQLIQEAKQDVEDLIEGNFDMSKVKA